MCRNGIGVYRNERDKRQWKLVNTVLYLVKTGGQWGNLLNDVLSFLIVHSFYRSTLDRILQHLVKITREKSEKKPHQTMSNADTTGS